jgi:hypothetical protein
MRVLRVARISDGERPRALAAHTAARNPPRSDASSRDTALFFGWKRPSAVEAPLKSNDVERAALQPAGALEWASTDVPNENVALARALPAPRLAGPAGRLGLGAATRIGANRIATECQWLRVEAAARSQTAAQLVRIECEPNAELQSFCSASICKSTYESVAGQR